MMIWFAVVSLLVSAQLCASANPGVKVRLTKKGIDYANKVAKDLLNLNLKNIKIPDQYDRDGRFSFRTSHFRVRSLDIPHSSARLRPDHTGLTWAIKDASFYLTIDYRALYEGWWDISNSGWIQAWASGINIHETVSFGKDWNGRPTVSHKSCSSSVGKLEIKFRGRWGFVINWFKGGIERKYKDWLRRRVCEEARKMVKNSAGPSLAKMPATSNMANDLYVDYRLVASPKVSSNYIELWDKGTVYSSSSGKSEPPFSPQSIPYWGSNNKMLYFWVTEYSFNSLLYQAHRNGDLKYKATKSNFPFLDTACKSFCIGALIPQFNEMYPDSSVEVFLTSPAMPMATMTTNSLTIDASTVVGIKVRSASNKLFDLDSLHMNVSVTFEPIIRSQILSGKITRHSFKLSEMRSENGQAEEIDSGVEMFLIQLLDWTLIQKLNGLVNQGVELPIPGDVILRDPNVKVKQGYILIETDVAKAW